MLSETVQKHPGYITDEKALDEFLRKTGIGGIIHDRDEITLLEQMITERARTQSAT